uniref:Uncharacterized protein n=1 Tax=Vespula pensylvanica TaxID=30213 RepID=A0A834N7V1_VESPE|nr:hypothetical protein H0235_015802 [Vespula pensylvanica]
MSKPDVNNWLRALTFAAIPGNWSLECTQTKILYHIRSNEGRYAEVKRTFLRLVRIVSWTNIFAVSDRQLGIGKKISNWNIEAYHQLFHDLKRTIAIIPLKNILRGNTCSSSVM